MTLARKSRCSLQLAANALSPSVFMSAPEWLLYVFHTEQVVIGVVQVVRHASGIWYPATPL
jgi:hypothetical protein